MAGKVTHEDLEKRVKDLEKQLNDFEQNRGRIDERTRAEHELSRTKALLDAVISQSSVPMVIMTSDSTIEVFNEASKEILGFSYDEVAPGMRHPDMKKSWQTYDADGNRIPTEQAPILRTLKKEITKSKEIRIVRKDGTERWVLMDAVPVYEQGGNIIGGFSVFQDITELKETEEALRGQEQKFRAIFNQTFQFIGLMTLDGTLTEVNRTALEFSEIEESDVIGKPFWETPWWTHSQKMQEQLRDAIRNASKGEFIRFEATHQASDGTLHVVDFSIKPVKDEAGNVTLLIPEGRDITQRKQAEEALRESEEKYRSLVSLSPDPIVIVQDGRHQMVSSAFTKIFGYTQQDVDNGLDALALVQEDYKETARKRVKDRIAGKELPQTVRTDMIAKDGRIITCESSFVLIQYNGRPAIFMIIRDITERKKIEEKMIIFQKFSEASEQGFGMADLKGNITYINPALCRLLGESKPEDAMGKNVRLYYPEEHQQKLENESLPMIIENGHWTGELDFLSTQGKIINTIQSIFLIRDDTGKAFCTANVITDITEHKQLDKILIHREKLKTLGAIAAEVAHEIRNPLTSLGGFAQRLKKKYPDSYECEIIINETQRLENILSRIRNYLEPVDIYPKECSINAIITSCVHLLSPETESREVKCVLDLDMELPIAYADPGILAQIIINLIRNATEAAANGGIVFIRSFEGGQDLCIEFKNRVLDMKHEDPETIFMPFAEGGKSVGLPLCYRLLKDMGGLLSFEQVEGFMVFTVSLPKTILPGQEKS